MVTRPAHYNTRYKHDLTPRQREVMDLLAGGRTNAEIAEKLGLTLDGAKWHVREILSKLNVESREEAASYWRSYNRPLSRISRALVGLLVPGALKAVLTGGATLAVVAVAVATVIAVRSLGGDEAPTSVETPAATPSPTPTLPPSGPEAHAITFARSVADRVRAGDLDQLFANASGIQHRCEAGDGIENNQPVCDGRAVGETVEAFRITLHGSAGTLEAKEAFEAKARPRLTANLELVSIGRATGDAAYQRIIVAFRLPGTMQVVYLLFDQPEAASGERALFGMGLSGDNAETIVAGGMTTTQLGETAFEPVK